MNILTTYIAPVFIGLTAFLTSIAMGGVTGASMTFAFGSGLVSGAPDSYWRSSVDGAFP